MDSPSVKPVAILLKGEWPLLGNGYEHGVGVQNEGIPMM